MIIVQRTSDNKWVILHGKREIDQDFDTRAEADSWADRHIDDQVFDSPNEWNPPLSYRGSTLDWGKDFEHNKKLIEDEKKEILLHHCQVP